jgi:hypothetical protein
MSRQGTELTGDRVTSETPSPPHRDLRVRKAPNNHARMSNNPLSRDVADGRTKTGRRIRDLYREFSQTLGHPGALATQAAILAVAELTALCEQRREQALQGVDVNLDQLIRLESEVRRKMRRLGLDEPMARTEPRVSLRQQLIEETRCG